MNGLDPPPRFVHLADDGRATPLAAQAHARCMVELLAHERSCEAELALYLANELDEGRLPDPPRLAQRFAPDPQSLPHVTVQLGAWHVYKEVGPADRTAICLSRVDSLPIAGAGGPDAWIAVIGHDPVHDGGARSACKCRIQPGRSSTGRWRSVVLLE